MLLRKIASKIEGYVRAMGLHPGDRVPTEIELVKDLKVTRYQLRKGMAHLKKTKGWVQIQGSGTYLPGGRDTPRPKEKTIAFAGPWPKACLADFDECQTMAMARGYYTAIFNATSDPSAEKKCLQAIKERHVTALCLEPTPIPPGNFATVDEFLAAGIKVALFNAPPELRDRYSIFLLDYHKAGCLGAGYLMKQGASRIVHISPLLRDRGYPWQHHDFRNGIRETASDFQTPLDLVPATCVLNEDRQVLEWGVKEAEIPFEEGLGYLCDQYSAAVLLQRELQAAGIRKTWVFSVHTVRINVPFAYAFLDNAERLRRMMAYALDGRIPSRQKMHEVIPPVIVPPVAADPNQAEGNP